VSALAADDWRRSAPEFTTQLPANLAVAEALMSSTPWRDGRGRRDRLDPRLARRHRRDRWRSSSRAGRRLDRCHGALPHQGGDRRGGDCDCPRRRRRRASPAALRPECLLPYFSKYRLDAIDAAACQAFKAKKLNEAAELRAAIDAGADVRDKSGKRARPLGPASIRKLITCLAAILDEAIEDGHIERNPARGARMRIRVPKPPRTFLEMDELVALIDAAADQDSR
jgi:hypothetical protein